MKTIAIPEDLHKELVTIRLEEGNKNAAELIRKLLIEYKRRKFEQASNFVIKAMKEKKLNLNELLKKSKKIREEVVNEQFPDLSGDRY